MASQISSQEMFPRLETRPECRMNADTAGRETKVMDKQIETMGVELAICEEDVKQKRQPIARAAERREYLRNKYTSE